MLKILKEFREFAVRGNVIDMAVGVIIGAAFGKVISSFVGDVLMPTLGMLLGKVDFKDLTVTLSAASEGRPAVTLNYGMFINTVIDFTLVALAIFLMIKGINRLKRQAPPPPPNTRDCPECLSAIPKKATRCAHCTAKVDAAA